MKKFLLIVSAALLLISCSASPKYDSRLVGKWKCDQFIAYEILELRSDMTYSVDAYWADGEQLLSYDGKYSVSENELTLEHLDYAWSYRFEYGNLYIYDTEEDTEYMFFRLN